MQIINHAIIKKLLSKKVNKSKMKTSMICVKVRGSALGIEWYF